MYIYILYTSISTSLSLSLYVYIYVCIYIICIYVHTPLGNQTWQWKTPPFMDHFPPQGELSHPLQRLVHIVEGEDRWKKTNSWGYLPRDLLGYPLVYNCVAIETNLSFGVFLCENHKMAEIHLKWR